MHVFLNTRKRMSLFQCKKSKVKIFLSTIENKTEKESNKYILRLCTNT